MQLTQNEIVELTKYPRLQELMKSSPDNYHTKRKLIMAEDNFITSDPDTIQTKARASKLSTVNHSVVITGETGTGKELLAKILHGNRQGAFVAVNSTALTETLFESELFGHIKGSFTGANDNRAGLIHHANDGTLFFDEIGDMPLSLQPKLLRVLQERVYRQVGSNLDQPMKCRVIAATHMDIPKLITEGRFRKDLWYRLNVFELRLKPLRERLDDIRLILNNNELADAIMLTHKQQLKLDIDDLKETDMYDKMLAATYPLLLPGNVRELLNIKARWEVFGEI